MTNFEDDAVLIISTRNGFDSYGNDVARKLVQLAEQMSKLYKLRSLGQDFFLNDPIGQAKFAEWLVKKDLLTIQAFHWTYKLEVIGCGFEITKDSKYTAFCLQNIGH